MIELDDVELATILAGLRLLQERGYPEFLLGIATGGGRFRPMNDGQIDRLYERLSQGLSQPGSDDRDED